MTRHDVPTRAFDPAGDPPLTVRQHPDSLPGCPAPVLAIRTADAPDEPHSPMPWLVLTGADVAMPLTDDEVADWPIAHPAMWSPQLRRDLDHLKALARKEAHA